MSLPSRTRFERRRQGVAGFAGLLATACLVVASCASPPAQLARASASPTRAGPAFDYQPSASNLAPCPAGTLPSNESIAPFGFKMVSATTGWALGQCGGRDRPFPGDSTVKCIWPQIETMGILRTTDGGRSWQDVSPPSVPNRSWPHTEFFMDATHAWAVEVARSATACVDDLVVFRTADGGHSWQASAPIPYRTSQPDGEVFNFCYCNLLSFADARNGLLVVGSPPAATPPGNMSPSTDLYRTADGGLSWTLVTKSPGQATLNATPGCQQNFYGLDGLTFQSATAGMLLVACPNPTLVVTGDGGSTWLARPLPSCVCQLYQFAFFDPVHGVATGSQSDVMMATDDGGATWAKRSLPHGSNFISFIDPGRGWVLNIAQLPTTYDIVLYRTTDGGRSWNPVGRPAFAVSTTGDPVSQFQFVDGNAGFAIATVRDSTATPRDAGGIREPVTLLVGTADGGHSWTVLQAQLAPWG
ncbi:MAG TPA: hypothetical protein VGG90_13750 [Candidatus Dormibacteraeota bacterium]|jgi:photosystem II stability/assembly factor-like uncharacterized protein